MDQTDAESTSKPIGAGLFRPLVAWFEITSDRINFCALEPFLHPSVVIAATHWSGLMHTEDGHTVETAVEARAGFLDRKTMAVLIVSTGLIIGIFATIYIGFFAR